MAVAELTCANVWKEDKIFVRLLWLVYLGIPSPLGKLRCGRMSQSQCFGAKVTFQGAWQILLVGVA